MYTKKIEQQDERLGRHIHHDPLSRGYAFPDVVDKSTWEDKKIRLYDPIPNPNQSIGNCTGCAKAMEFNSVGNRVTGYVNDMEDANNFYSRATDIDPWPGTWPPDDTGSSGLAVAKAARQLDRGRRFHWAFSGADQVVQMIMQDHVVSLGTYWHYDMFTPDSEGIIHATGGHAGGHQYIARGYWKSRDLVMLRCWWGDFQDVWIPRSELSDPLLSEDGDAHTQKVRG